MFDLSFLFPFFLLLSLCRAFNFRYVCVLSRDFVCYSHTPAYCLFKGCGFTNTTDGRADPIRASTIVSAWHRLYIRICRRGSGYSGAFPWRSTNTLIIGHEWRLKYGEPRCSSSIPTNRCSSSSKRARNSRRCSSCRRKSTAEIPLYLPAERLQAFLNYLLKPCRG